MIRLFSLLSVIAVFMIVITGGSVYWLSNMWVTQTKKDAAAIKAKSFTLSLSAQVDQLNKTLDKMSQDPELLTAIITANPALQADVITRLEHYLPYVLKIRVLPPGVNQLDETSAPRMGYADLEMVQKTFNDNQFPSVQGDEGKDKHVAMTRKIKQGDAVVGVILASLTDGFLRKSIDTKQINNIELGSIELMQEKRLLAASGKQPVSKSDDVIQVKVANTNWLLYYHYRGRASFGEIGAVFIIVFVTALISLLSFLIVQRKLSDILKRDLESVAQASKDLLRNKAQGSYPTHLIEMSTIIMELMQFKRVLDSQKNETATRNNNIAINNNDEEFESVDVESFFDD